MKPTTIIRALIVLSAVPTIGRGQQVDMATAQKQFDKYCAKCHGSEGRGDGQMSALLTQQPKDFTDCAAMAKEPDNVLLNVIKNGGAPVQGQRSDMPAMGKSLSDSEIRALLARVREFCTPGEELSLARGHAAGHRE